MADTQFTIYVDDREKKPYPFRRFPVSTEERRLKTGDYCVKDDGGDSGGETFDANYAVERKTAPDFLESITWSRDRFEQELERADTMSNRMPIVIEKPLQYFMSEKHYADVSANSIAGTLQKHPEFYNVEYFFNRDRKRGQQLTYEFLQHRAKKLSLL